MSDVVSQTRRTELSRNLAAAQDRVAEACRAADRSPDEVTMIVVTKFFPPADIECLADLGVRDIGENRDQEASAKAGMARDRGLRIHLIGQVQTNKARSVARYADIVHSVDRARLVTALDRAAVDQGRRIPILLQVDLGDLDRPDRGGVEPAGIGALADLVAGSTALELRGLMTVAPLDRPPQEVFQRLEVLAADLRGAHPQARWISAGMSSDLESAVAHGATHVRLGSAVLGSRPGLG